jgi:3-oxoacyl-[acyl-carrier protein] reductase
MNQGDTMDLGLTGKIALVAASSKGLGYGIARALAGEGMRVALCARNTDEVRAAAEKITDETGVETHATACDVTDSASVSTWVESVVAWGGGLDALVVNAGGPPALQLQDATDEQWQAAFNLTLMSAARMIRVALPHLRDGGAILTVTSSSVREPIPTLGLSTVMRAGIFGMVKVLSDELAPRRIRVNNLIPGRIETDRVQHLDNLAAQRTGSTPQEIRAGHEARIPLKRLGRPDEFGAAAAFLLSPTAGYITGTSLRVDGGAMRSVDF